MSGKNTTYSQTLKLSTEFNGRSVVEGLKKIKDSLSTLNASAEGKKILAELNKEFAGLDKILSSVERRSAKGFTNDKEVQAFNKEVDSIIEKILQAQSSLEKLTNIQFPDKQLKKSIEEIQKTINNIITQTTISLTDKLPKKIADSIISQVKNAKSLQEVYEKITIELEKERQAQEAALKIEQEQGKLRAEEEAKSSKIKKQKLNETMLDSLELQRAYGGEKGASIRGTGSKGGVSWNTKGANFGATMSQLYRETLSESIKAGEGADDALTRFTAKLKEYGVALQDDALFAKTFKTALESIRDEMSKAEPNPKIAEGLKANIESIVQQQQANVNIRADTSFQLNEGLIGDLKLQAEELYKTVSKGKQEQEDASKVLGEQGPKINENTKAWREQLNALNDTADAQKNIDDNFSRLLNRIQGIFSIGSAFYFVRQQVVKTFQDIQSLDKSFAQIAMVTEYHVNDLWQSYGQYAEMANRLGQSTNDVIQASVLFYQQGLETNDVLRLTEDTMKLATLAGTGFAEATDLMTAAIRGFRMEMDQGAHITDVYSELAAHAAASVDEIANAMNKTAAIAASAGMSFENTAAFLTQMIESTQESANNLGTAMKTVIARFTELKENVDASDSEFDDLDYNKVDKALKSVGISLKDTNGQFRDLDDVFLELSSRWSSLSRNEQRYIATIAAGSRQQSRFIALMSDYQRTLELVEIAQDSAGRSTEQFGKYAESIEYKIKQLQNTWEQFRIGITNSETYGKVLDFANNLLNTVSKFDKIDYAKWATLFFTVGRYAGTSFIQGLRKGANLGTSLVSALSVASDTGKSKFLGALSNRVLPKEISSQIKAVQIQEKEDLKNLHSLLSQRERVQKQLVQAQNATQFNNYPKTVNELQTQLQAIETQINTNEDEIRARFQDKRGQILGTLSDKDKEKVQAVVAEQYQAIGATAATALTAAFISVTARENPLDVFLDVTKASAVAGITALISVISTSMQKGLSTVDTLLTTSKTGLIILGIATAIGVAAAGAKALSNYIEKTRVETAKANSGFYASQKVIETLSADEEELGQKAEAAAEKYKEASESYKDLTSRGEKLEELSQKMLLTNEEQEEFNKLSNEMAELFPDLVQGYDAENNAIIDLADSYKKLVDSKEKALKQAALEQSKTALDYQVNQYEQALAQYQGVQDLAEKIQENPIYQALATGRESSKLPNGTFIDWSGLVRNGSVEVTSYNQDGVGSTESYSYKDLSYRDILEGFLNTDARGYGKELSEILKGTSFKLPEKDADVIQSILDQLQTDNTGTKLDEFRTAFTTYSNNFDVSTKYLQSQRSQLQTAAQTYAGDYLALNNPKYQSITDKNAQVAFQNYALTQAGIDFDEIEKDYNLAKFNGDYEAQARAIQGYITTTLEKASTVFDSTEFSPQVISAYEKITKAIADGLNIREIAQIAQEGFGDTDLYQLFTEQFKTQIDKYNENLKTFIGALGTTPAIFNKGTGLYETDNSLINNLMTIGSEAQDKLVKAVQDATSTGTLKGFVDGLTSLTDKDINLARIFNYNWENTLSGIAEAEAYFIEKYGEEIGNQILSIARQAGLIDFRITNVDELEDFEKSFSESISTVSKQISSYGSIVKNYRENGRLNLSDINTLSEIGAPLTEIVNSKLQLDEVGFEKWIEDSIKEQGNLVDSVVLEAKERLEVLEALKAEQEGIYTASVLQENYNKLVQDKNAHIITQKELDDIINASDITSTLNQKIAQQREIVESLQAGAAKRMELQLIAVKAALEDANKTVDETPNKVKTLQETYEKAADALAEKQQTLIDKQKELNKVLYGDSTHKNKLDELYNYQTAFDVLKEKADDAKEALEDLDEQNPANLIDDWLGASRDQSIYLAAENDRYRTAIRNTESMLRNQLTNYMKGIGRGTDFNVSDYFYYNPALDRYFINQQKLNQAQMNDQLKDFIGEQVDLMNTYKKNIKTNQNEIKKLDKEWIEYQKSARDNYVSVQNEIVERLKSSYQEEIDDKEKMYEALKEADDNYVNALEDAINRQRRLRDEQDKWDSLATKEKRLSLLQRDTSGAQQKETLKLQREIEKDRTSLLDTSIDNVVNELKDLYATQQETRSKELEYQQSILDNSNLVVEANAIMQSWKSMDEMIAWMYEHTEGIENMSDQAVEQLTDDWKEMFNNIQIYNETSQKEAQNFYTTNTAEVQRVLNNTTESLTSEAQRAFRETSAAVSDSITTAEKAVTDAMDALKESQEALTKAQNEYNEALARMSAFTKDIVAPDQQVYYGTNYMAETAKLKSQTDHTTWKTMEEIQDQAERTRLGIDNDNLWNLYKQYAEIVQSVESSKAEGERRGYQQELDRFLQGHKAYMIGDNIYIDDEAQSQLEKFMVSTYGQGAYSIFDFLTGKWMRYDDGGLANYTGPAWVDGTNSKPEAFLSAEDTQRIGSAAKILANLPFFKMDGSLYQGTTTTVGDTNVELHIHVDSIATESQVDYLINRIKEDIVDSANPIGTPVVAYR